MGLDSQQGQGIFSLRHEFNTGTGAHPASYLMGTGRTFLGIKRLELNLTNHIHLMAKLKMRGTVYSLPYKSS